MSEETIDPTELAELRELARRVSSRIVAVADAEDVAQEALLRLTREWPRVGSYARPWIVRVATNLAIAQLRCDGRSHDITVTDSEFDPQAEIRIDLASAVRALPVRQRQAVVLRYLADQDETTVAALLGCSRGSVKRHLHRAVAALRTSPHLTYPDNEGVPKMAATEYDWKNDFIPATEPNGGWPPRPWDHWFIHQNGSRDRVAVDARGEPVIDADGDEVMSGPGFKFEVVKLRPRDEPEPPEQPDPRPAARGTELEALLDEAQDFAAWFGHPWVGDEHLGLALAARGALDGISEKRLAAAVAEFYEGPFAQARLEIVRQRRSGAPFARQPDASFSWNRSLNQTIAAAATPSPGDVGRALLEQPRALVRTLLERADRQA